LETVFKEGYIDLIITLSQGELFASTKLLGIISLELFPNHVRVSNSAKLGSAAENQARVKIFE
jgi:hypothetical protein